MPLQNDWMNEILGSAMAHGFAALVLQLILWRVFGIWAAGTIAFAVLFGREIAQHEYKGGGPKVVEWYYGLIHHWNLDSTLDLVIPLAVCLITGAVVTRWRAGRAES